MSDQVQVDRSQLSVAELVERIQSGDRLAENEMVIRHHRQLLLILRRKSTSDIADDVAQETWRVVIEKVRAGEIREPDKLPAFIAQIGRNQLTMYFRRNENTGADDSSVKEGECEESEASYLLERQESANFIKQALSEMKTERDRDILQRFYLKDEDKDVICRDLDLSELHFNRVLHRAKQRFRKLLEGKL